MSSRTHHFRIGLFVLAGAALFVGALFAMGLKTYFGERDLFETYVAGKVENLSVGALVKLRGVTIGKVSAIQFVGTEYPDYHEQYVLIKFEVPKGAVWGARTNNIQAVLDAEAARGLRARVQGQGFLGASILALEYVDPKLYPVEPLPWTPKHFYIPSAPSQFNRLLASLETSLSRVQDLDLAELQARANKLLDAASRLVGNLNQVDFQQLGTNASSLVVEFRQTNRGLQRTLADAQHALADAQHAINGADLPAIGRDTVALEAKLSAVALELRHLLASVDTGELNSSLANVRAATDELVVLLHDLEQRPSSVLFSKAPKPLSVLEKPPRK
jgi:phospholipid/cholesterol/gamma-HCH transport system substrate-binding protein